MKKLIVLAVAFLAFSVSNASAQTFLGNDEQGVVNPDGQSLAVTSSNTVISGTVTVNINNGSGAAAVNIQDGGNSITVDAVQLDVDDLTFAADKVDASGSTLGANSGVDVGDVTINNAAAGGAVNIQDGGNVISIDDAGTTISIDDGGGSITVDGTFDVTGSTLNVIGPGAAIHFSSMTQTLNETINVTGLVKEIHFAAKGTTCEWEIDGTIAMSLFQNTGDKLEYSYTLEDPAIELTAKGTSGGTCRMYGTGSN